MAWNKRHKKQTRNKILESAASLFTMKGYKNVSIDEVMEDAGLTRGAFYAHSSSKSELYAESIIFGAKNNRRKMQATDKDTILKTYLSMEHRDGEAYRCPLGFLVTDIAQRDEQVRDAYTRVLKGLVNYLGQETTNKKNTENTTADKQKNIQRVVMMVGGLAIARAVNDDLFAEDVLQACQEALLSPDI